MTEQDTLISFVCIIFDIFGFLAPGSDTIGVWLSLLTPFSPYIFAYLVYNVLWFFVLADLPYSYENLPMKNFDASKSQKLGNFSIVVIAYYSNWHMFN